MKQQFVMASTDSESFAQPRGCCVVAELTSESRNDLLLVDIDPPVIGQEFGLGGEDICRVVIASRLEARKMFQLARCWPIPVYVLLSSAALEGPRVCDDDLCVVAWAEVYPSITEFTKGGPGC